MSIHRRRFLRSLAGGGLLLPGMLSEIMATETMTTGPMPDVDPLAPKPPHFAAKAKRVIFLFMTGGVSHVDTFDPTPVLNATHAEQYRGRNFY